MTKKKRGRRSALQTFPKSSIILLKRVRGGEYDEVIDAAFAAAGQYGSAANAIAKFVEESPSFRRYSAEAKSNVAARRGT